MAAGDYTVTLLANHKGVTTPKVVGDEYCVDASVDVEYAGAGHAGGVVLNAVDFGLSTISAAAITGMSKVAADGGYLDDLCFIMTTTSGTYESSTSIRLLIGSAGNTDVINGTRMRVWGQI